MPQWERGTKTLGSGGKRGFRLPPGAGGSLRERSLTWWLGPLTLRVYQQKPLYPSPSKAFSKESSKFIERPTEREEKEEGKKNKKLGKQSQEVILFPWHLLLTRELLPYTYFNLEMWFSSKGQTCSKGALKICVYCPYIHMPRLTPSRESVHVNDGSSWQECSCQECTCEQCQRQIYRTHFSEIFFFWSRVIYKVILPVAKLLTRLQAI